MIVSEEQLALLTKWPSVAVDFTLDDVAETIEELKRQLAAERVVIVREMAEAVKEWVDPERVNISECVAQLEKCLPGDGSALDAYVQEKVDRLQKENASLKETLEVLEDTDLVKQLIEAHKDIAEGRTIGIEELRKKLGDA